MGSSIIVASWSEIDTGRQCPHKHELAYKDRWQSSGSKPALAKGILWHSVAETHYRFVKRWREEIWPHLDTRGRRLMTDDALVTWIDGRGWDAFINDHPVGKELWAEIRPHLFSTPGVYVEHGELIEWMYEGYVRYWGLDEGWRIKAVEHAAEYPLYDPKTGRKTRFRIKTKIDLIVEQAFRGKWRTCMVDHKSGKDLPKKVELDLADQFTLYDDCLHRVGLPVFVTIHNACRTYQHKQAIPLDERHQRTMLDHTDIERATVASEALATLRMMYGFKPGEAPRHPDPDRCKWKCDFTDPCLASRRGMDEVTFLARTGFQQNRTRH